MSKDKMEFRDVLRVEGVRARGFGIIPKLVMLDRKLTIEAKAIYSYFCSYAGAGSIAFPSRDKICNDLGIGKDRYYKHFNLLKEYGYIEVEQVKNDNNKFSHNVYTLVEKPTFSPCTENKDTEIEDTENKDINSNRSFIKNNRSLYNNQSVIEEEKNKDRQTDIETEKETIIEQAQIDLYKGEHRKLLETTIEKLLKLKEIKVNDATLNSKQIREQLSKLDISILDFTFRRFRQAQAEKEIKNKHMYFTILLLNCIDEYPANNILE